MAETRSHEVELVGHSVEYDLRRSADATKPRIDVDIHGVTVVIPDATDVDPEEVLQENAVWVVEKKAKYDTYREEIPERSYEEGAMFPYLGDEREVVVERRSSSVVSENALRLARHHVEETSVKRALETLYRRKARETFEERAEHFAEQIGVTHEQIEVRNQRTKWGSCSTTGTLGLNWRLMMAPPEIVDYIVIHELAHLREPNHTDAFWSLVGEHDPDYEAHARWLEENSTQLVFSDDDL
ncbi:M48 family metallopeptidase [Halococcoides cellulosivorans]|uniref:Metal-dependent hydrolase n=1 Tax=Halococcoides cellulosivorans TaxID=1679096 RepID=A0A2R4WYD2_9EURY|nr:SprT family zinc-dependent metalloprotease [Halococcoides cellulosivorans]AWB26536.1 metal-dependent hydrolase [Halococcoides cellulosivorans]